MDNNCVIDLILRFVEKIYRHIEDYQPLQKHLPYTEAFSIDFDSYATFFSVNSAADDFLKEMRAQTKELKGIKEALQQLVEISHPNSNDPNDASE